MASNTGTHAPPHSGLLSRITPSESYAAGSPSSENPAHASAAPRLSASGPDAASAWRATSKSENASRCVPGAGAS